MQRKIVYAGAHCPSFCHASAEIDMLAEMAVSEKQVERMTHRIGLERVAERTEEVEAYQALPLASKRTVPPNVEAPSAVVVMVDGGRLQIMERGREAESAKAAAAENPDAETATTGSSKERGGRFWREDKIGLLLKIDSAEAATDPCPEIPEGFVDPTRIMKLAREIKSVTIGEDGVAEPKSDAESPADEEAGYEPPLILERQALGSRLPWPEFAPQVAQAAWDAGFWGASRQAFVADGAETNWTMQRKHFPTFVPVLDFIHALSYVFAAATAGRKFTEGWPCYERWIGWVWQGQTEKVIVELAQRQQELGIPSKDESATSPRNVVADALTYLQNHKDKMRYDECRRLGLPITSSHVESLVKQFNRRVKGTEKFWSESGAEAILQLRGDYLSDGEPMDGFWQRRQTNETGQRRYRKAG